MSLVGQLLFYAKGPTVNLSVKNAYSAAAEVVRTPRETETTLLATLTARMTRAAQGMPQSFGQLVAVLHDNRMMWTAFASDLSNPANGLPVQLKARLIHLAHFTSVHTSKVLAREASPDILIEINTAVLRGLSAKGEA